MAATIHQLPSCGLAKEDCKISGSSNDLLWKEVFRDSSEWLDNHNIEPSPRLPDFKHRINGELLWTDSWCPCWVYGELRNQGLIEEPSHATLPTAQIDSFITSLRACTWSKDLARGTSIHHDLVQGGLLEECSDALVTMYAKCGELGNAKRLLDMHESKDVITWTALISGYVNEGQGHNALDFLEQMKGEGILPNAVTYVCALKACATIKDLDRGKRIHDELGGKGLLQNNIVLGGALVDMYAKCRATSEARQVLEELPFRNVISWNALIAGYAQEGEAEQALNCLEQMQLEGILPNAATYICTLKACAMIRDAQRGKQIHDEIAKQGLLKNHIVLGGALVDMFAKCGDVSEAQRVLEELPSRDVVSWNALIAGYAREGESEQALNCLDQMRHDDILPNAVTYVCALKACATNKIVDRGKKIHDEIVRQGLLQKNVVLGGALVDMYAKCGAISEAREVLGELPSRNVVSWNALIAGCAQEGDTEQALNCIEQMEHEGILPNAVTYVCMLKACTVARAADRGEQIHRMIARDGLLRKDIVLGNALVDMYAKCGAVSEAQRVLEELPFRDVVSWNALIAGYATEGEAKQALNCLEQMGHEGILPDAVTYACALKACAVIRAADRGRQIHNEIVRQGLLHIDIVLGSALVDMYAKCGDIQEAQRVLKEMPSRDVVAWNALIAGYTQEGEAEQALNCLERMQHEGILPNAVTYVSALKACSMIRAIDMGKEIHNTTRRRGFLQNDIVLGGALVDMYAKCNDIPEARRVLKELSCRDVVSWNALLSGYVEGGEAEQALSCLEWMQHEGILPNAVTFICALKACAAIRDVYRGKQIHDKISRQGLLQNNIMLVGALVDMYAKCGCVSEARWVLEKFPSQSVVSWNGLIGGYAQEGEAEEALNCLEQMHWEGVIPNAVTCTCVLNVCSHRGLIEEGQALFVNMYTKYGVEPSVECYTSMIDLFGRAGHLEKAVRLIQEMPSSDYTAVWHALLGSCGKWADVNVGGWAFEQAVKLDRGDGPAYVLMANLYAAAGMEDKAEIIEAMRIGQSPGYGDSSNPSNIAYDTKHVQNKCIDDKLQDISHKMSRLTK